MYYHLHYHHSQINDFSMTDDKIDYENMFKKSVESQTLTRDDYPDAKLKIRRWTTGGIEHEAYCVSVGIPRPIRHLFGQAPSKYLVAGKTQEEHPLVTNRLISIHKLSRHLPQLF